MRRKHGINLFCIYPEITLTYSSICTFMNLVKILRRLTKSMNYYSFQVVDPYYVMAVEIHMLIILGPLIAFNLIPSLKMLAPFSALANVMTFVGLGIVVYYLVVGKKPEAQGEPLDLWGSAETFPLFFGTVLFALTAVGVVSNYKIDGKHLALRKVRFLYYNLHTYIDVDTRIYKSLAKKFFVMFETTSIVDATDIQQIL